MKTAPCAQARVGDALLVSSTAGGSRTCWTISSTPTTAGSGSNCHPPDGTVRTVHVRKGEGEDLGLEFQTLSHGLPQALRQPLSVLLRGPAAEGSMRRSLYFKDERRAPELSHGQLYPRSQISRRVNSRASSASCASALSTSPCTRRTRPAREAFGRSGRCARHAACCAGSATPAS
jgi:hypothetical protein